MKDAEICKISKDEKKLIGRYLKFMTGFEESSLYEDYMGHETFSDAEYGKAIDLLYKIAKC